MEDKTKYDTYTPYMIQGSSEPLRHHYDFEDPDIVKVVRCKDCDRVHIDFDNDGRTRYSCNNYYPMRIMVSDDGMMYCSNGRRQK